MPLSSKPTQPIANSIREIDLLNNNSQYTLTNCAHTLRSSGKIIQYVGPCSLTALRKTEICGKSRICL